MDTQMEMGNVCQESEKVDEGNRESKQTERKKFWLEVCVVSGLTLALSSSLNNLVLAIPNDDEPSSSSKIVTVRLVMASLNLLGILVASGGLYFRE
jgi:hypothetical protein